ncbi:MAG: hypothetical protein RI900_512 [Actinomycetota bacterium]
MGLLDTIKGLVKGNKKTIIEGVDKAADLIQSKTSSDVDAQVEKGASVVKDLVEKLDDSAPEQK